MDLEVLAERDGQVALEALDEFVVASDAQDGREEVVEAGDLPALLLGMGGGVVFFCGSTSGDSYAWSCGNSASRLSLQEIFEGKKLLNMA